MKLFGVFQDISTSKIKEINYVNFYEDAMVSVYNEIDEYCKYDLELYLRYAAISNGNILELACGSGRILLELVKRGYNVTGIDLSMDMLDLLKLKYKKLPKWQRENIKVFNMNMLNLDLPNRYELVILPATTICLIDDNDIPKLFDSVYQVLKNGGYFIFDYCVYKNTQENEETYDMETFVFEEKDKTCVNLLLMQESVNYKLKNSIVNFFLEKIYYTGETKRYLSNTIKNITDESYYMHCIEETKFVKAGVGDFGDMSINNKRKIKYIILKKI